MKGAILGVLKALKYFKKTDSQIREVLVNDLVMGSVAASPRQLEC